MSLVVDLRLSGEPIELTEAAATVPDATFEIEHWRQHDEHVVWYVWVRGEDLDRATAAFESLSHVVDVGVVNDAGSVRLYRVSLVPNVDTPPRELVVEGAVTEGTIEPDCLRLSARISGRDVLAGLNRFLRTKEIDVAVEALHRAGDDGDDDGLTDGQFEALVTAYEMGYFDQPKAATQDEVAAALGIARSSLSERLRRAERHLVRERLDP